MKYIKLLILSFFVISVNAQDNTWTLQECIDFALDNNLSVKRGELNVMNADINLRQAQYSRLPNLNANGSFAFGWGRSIDPTTNLFVDNQRIASSNASASSNLILFNGLNITNSIKQNEFTYKSSEKTLEDTKNDVILNVVTFYTNVLFARELYENAVKQLESTSQQVVLTEKRVKAGALPQANLLDLLAQKATNELNKVNRENDYNNARIQLKQSLQLPPEQNITIVLPEFDAEIKPLIGVTALEIYNIALNDQPDIQAAKLNTEGADYGVKSSEGALYPTLSLNGGLSTQYSDVADGPRFIPDGGAPITTFESIGFVEGTNQSVLSEVQIPSGEFLESYPFAEQYEDQLRKFISLNLNIPIFNRFVARSNVERAKISKSQAEISEKEVKYQLWQSIEQAYNNVGAAAKSYESSQKQVEAREESFRVIKQRYDFGAVNFVDYQVAENDLYRAKSDLLRAKYDYIFRLKILDFYQGKPLDF